MALPRLNFQVTIQNLPNGAPTPIVSGLPANTGALSGPQNTPGGFQPWAIGDVQVSFLLIQNNAAHNIRYGGPNVSVTAPAAVNGGTAGNGILLTLMGSGAQSVAIELTTNLLEWYVAGTPGDVVDILFIP